ncbi:MAG: carboxypeptidase M32 [Chloroherpetonaceae bacterium]|nr:carboxypeptidase M32 [Chthonomonadaceae bacterium]MDW8207366.1 carboxypeptidase M32 [Chloroherpetonaceae bacterium]
MSQSFELLKARVRRVVYLNQAAGLLGWDQQTYMPAGAAETRGEQIGTLSELAHELFTADETGQLLEAAERETEGMEADSDERRMLALLRRQYERATRLPASFVAELSRHQSHSFRVWVEARARNDFALFQPALEKMFDLVGQQAGYYGYRDHIYDALLDGYEQGATHASVAAMFAGIKPALVALTQAIVESRRDESGVSALQGFFPVEAQRQLTLHVLEAIGFDLRRGRQDEAAHPFCANFGRDDVRLTTRYDTAHLTQGLYSSLHEAGHGLYEQGSAPEYEGTVLAGGTSLGVHESQSRLWENLVGRGRPFVRYLLPVLQRFFPDALEGVDAEDLYRAVNRVEPSLIRVEADEVTYNLHVLLRFEIESDLLTGKMAVRELPEVWNARMREYLGVVPPDDASGCLQDVHWSEGLIGYFPTYSLGNLYSAQIWDALRAALPDLDAQIERGVFAPMLDWLQQHIYRYGSKYPPAELITRATGAPPSADHYAAYLQTKYRDLYRL